MLSSLQQLSSTETAPLCSMGFPYWRFSSTVEASQVLVRDAAIACIEQGIELAENQGHFQR